MEKADTPVNVFFVTFSFLTEENFTLFEITVGDMFKVKSMMMVFSIAIIFE